MARKPDLPGAADFFQSGAAKQGQRETSQKRSAKPDQNPNAQKSQDAHGDGAEERGAVGSGAYGTLTPEMESLSVEPPQTIQQPPTEKVTFYLPARLLEDLEVCRVRLLTEYKLKVNRSQITQAALALTLNRPELIADALVRLDELARELQET